MRKIIVFTNLSLDGVMQAPGRPDEDTRGDFPYGGWGAPYAAMSFVKNSDLDTGPLLFGRRTYEDFYSVWPNRTDNPYTQILNNAQKYVASNTLKEPLPWINSTLLKGDVPAVLAELKSQPGKNFLVMGSGMLVQTLMQHNLVDLYVLLIHPLIIGTGRRLFIEGSPNTTLRLLNVNSTPNGVTICTYQPV
ncbi:MAG TPA: dihydrofolate reductase family protein [Anaerolineales bacterium]|nr:dihydrofolate reductase family protein [Anaerolineales bacterium]